MKERLQTYLEHETMAALKKLAQLQDRSPSNMAAVLLAECLEAKRREWREHQALPSIQNAARLRQSKKRRDWQEIEDMPLSPDESE